MYLCATQSYIEVNATTEFLPLKVSYSPMALWQWQLQVQMEDQFATQRSLGLGGASDRELDTMRELFLETNPWLLALTFLVSLLHSLFDFLAFKNDIQFWRRRKSMQGLSVKSLAINCFIQTVVFLYLLDNDTSYMILTSSGMSTLIEFWKLTKAFHIHVDFNYGLPVLTWKAASTYAEHDTRRHDTTATVHLMYILLPLCIGYAAYSLIYRAHKSYYSWILNTLVGFVYAFGFILMTPQLFINYKLKSVAHMPWRAMVYKVLNTFVDDLFAFVIKMPTLHRLACFRDDIIFFIYLYQKWIYRIDYSRTNEFGQEGNESSNQKKATICSGNKGNDACPHVGGHDDDHSATGQHTKSIENVN